MIKSELIAKLAAKMMNLPEKKVKDSVNCILKLMNDTLAQNERIEIRGFGSFTLHYRAPRQAHNPKTGEKVITKGKHTPHFKPGKALRERIEISRAMHPICDDDDTLD